VSSSSRKSGWYAFYLPSGAFPVPPAYLHPELNISIQVRNESYYDIIESVKEDA